MLNLSSGGCDWAALCTMYIDKPELVNLHHGLHTPAPAERAPVGLVGSRGLGTRGKTYKDRSFRI